MKIAVCLLEQGKMVLRSVGEGCRYDLLVDDGGKFTRIQCKTGWIRNGVILFNTVSNYAWKKERPGYEGQADVFGIYCPDNGKIYIVPVDKAPINRAGLRLDPPKNGQVKGVMLAKDFEVPVAQLDRVRACEA